MENNSSGSNSICTMDLSQSIVDYSTQMVHHEPRFSENDVSNDHNLDNIQLDTNFSWLLNFKLDNLIPNSISTNIQDTPSAQVLNSNSCNNLINKSFETMQMFNSNQKSYDTKIIEPPPPLQIENNKLCSDVQFPISLSPQKQNNSAGIKKPPFTYTELIEHALQERGELTVSGIYQWISDHFPFYKANDDRWKNSVRHNLSINPHFRKGGKAVHGAGHLWTIATIHPDDEKTPPLWLSKKQKIQEYIEANLEKKFSAEQEELRNATLSILPDQQSSMINDFSGLEDMNDGKKKVEVQYIIPIDLICPVSKDQILSECTLQNDAIMQDECERVIQMVTSANTTTTNTITDYFITSDMSQMDESPSAAPSTCNSHDLFNSDQLFYSDDLGLQYTELLI